METLYDQKYPKIDPSMNTVELRSQNENELLLESEAYSDVGSEGNTYYEGEESFLFKNGSPKNLDEFRIASLTNMVPSIDLTPSLNSLDELFDEIEIPAASADIRELKTNSNGKKYPAGRLFSFDFCEEKDSIRGVSPMILNVHFTTADSDTRQTFVENGHKEHLNVNFLQQSESSSESFHYNYELFIKNNDSVKVQRQSDLSFFEKCFNSINEKNDRKSCSLISKTVDKAFSHADDNDAETVNKVFEDSDGELDSPKVEKKYHQQQLKCNYEQSLRDINSQSNFNNTSQKRKRKVKSAIHKSSIKSRSGSMSPTDINISGKRFSFLDDEVHTGITDGLEKSTTKRKKLAKSKSVTSAGKKHTCDICERSFQYKSRLLQHVQMHALQKPFSCDICGVTFKFAYNLPSHMKLLHSESVKKQPKVQRKKISFEKRYSCDQCDMSFKFNCKLQRHVLTHAEEKTFTCEICNAAFKHSCNLKAHVESHKSEKKSFDCADCGNSYSNKSNLIRHHCTVAKLKENYICSICKTSFNKLRYFRSHVCRTCNYCDRVFTKMSNFKRHIKTHVNE